MEEEKSRLAKFQVIRSQIRQSDSVLLVGIDVAKNTHHAFFGTPQGKTLDSSLVFENDIDGFELLRKKAHHLAKSQGLTQVVFGLEPTSSYHKPLSEYLIRHGDEVVLVSSAAVTYNRNLLNGRWDKNDKKDAANVADLVGQGRCLFYDLPQGPLAELRRLLVFRIHLKKREHGLRLRLRNNLFAQYFPELERFLIEGQGDEIAMKIAEHCLDPRAVAAMEFSEFCLRVTRRRSRGKREARLRGIWEAAHKTIGCEVPEAAQWEARGLVAQFRETEGLRKQTDLRVTDLATKLPGYRLLLTIPGFGPVIAPMFMAAIGNPFRFNNSKQVLRLAGFDLCARRSGETSNRATPVISKQGKGPLRYALVQAAMSATRSHPTLRRYYQNRLSGREGEKGIRLKLRVKMAAKLLVVAWTMMKREEEFDPRHFQV